MRPPRFAALAAVALLLVPALAEARTIGSGKASGKRAFAGATANITSPRLLAVRVISKPAQRASGKWSVVCDGIRRPRSGSFAGRGRFTRVLGLPRGKRKACFVVASVRLAGTGRVTLEILGH